MNERIFAVPYRVRATRGYPHVGVAFLTRYCQKIPLPTVGNEWDCRSIYHSVCDRVGNFIGPLSSCCVEKPFERVKTMLFCFYDVYNNFMETVPLMKVS